jgi:MarR family transcriptional regulator, lower aerobic nicotinate degradation pathway regulator
LTRWSLSSSVEAGCDESMKGPRCETTSALRTLSVDVANFWVLKMPDGLSVLAPTAFDLASRPGFLIRRLHQIHVALFADECAAFDVTPVQYSIMTVVRAQPGLDQVRLAAEVGVDRTTLASVLARLEHRALVRRWRSDKDRRLKYVGLTQSARKLLNSMDERARRAHERTLEALPSKERAAFVHALARLVDAGNEYGRAPLRLA